MKISFDYDGTFTRDDVKRVARDLSGDHEVYILSARDFKENLDLYKAAFALGLQPHQVLYSRHKFQTIHDMGIQLHVDNDPEMLDIIRRTSKCQTVDCTKRGWIERVFGFVE